MAPYDPWADTRSRLEAFEDRLLSLERSSALMMEKVVQIEHEERTFMHHMQTLEGAFKAFRTALYSAATIIVIAAISVIIWGHP